MNSRKFNTMHEGKGITLIALVITIIVLLILAAVSIATLTGDNGILNKAIEAVDATNRATLREKVQAEVLGSYDNRANFDIDKFKENVKKSLGLADDDIKNDESIDGVQFEVNGLGVRVTGQGEVLLEGEEAKYPTKPTVSSKPSAPSEDSEQADPPIEENPPVRKPPETQTYTLTEGASQKSSTMIQYVGTDNGTVNPIFKSYDSTLMDVIGQCIVGHNSWKQHLESVGFTVAPNHDMLYSIEFTTNAKEFMFTAVGSLRVSVDEKDGKGYLYTNEEGEVDIEGDNSYLHATGYDASKFRFIKVSFEDSKERNIKIELIGAFANLYADAQYYVKTIEKEKPKTMMFVGDSWTTGHSSFQGTTAELSYRSYPTIISNNLGMTAINLGVGGTGYTKMSGNDLTYYQERMQYSLNNCGIEPDYIFICGGGNDVTDVKYGSEQKSLEDIVKAADSCYKYAKTAFPNAKVIVLGLEYVEGGDRYEASSELKQLNELLKAKAKDNQIPYIDFVNGEAIDGSGNKVHENDNFVSDPSDLSDSIHLTYEGYKKMANKLTPVIEKLIK